MCIINLDFVFLFVLSDYKLFPHGDDQRHVAVTQYLDHTLLVERDAAARIGLGTFHVDEDGTAIGIDAFLVEVSGDAIVVLRLVGVHLLALTLVLYDGGVDNLVVVLTVLVTGIGGWCHVDVGHRGAGIGLDAEGIQRTECTDGRLGIPLTFLTKAVLTDIYVGDEQYLAINGQTGLTLAAMHVIYFEQLSMLSGDYTIVTVA